MGSLGELLHSKLQGIQPREKSLGFYLAFITDRRRAVVLRFLDRVIVISQDRPEDFVKAIPQYTNRG